MNPARWADDLGVAHVLADAADSVTMDRYRALDLKVETKPDLTPVTDADRTTEDAIRATLKRARPRDAMLGEETGLSGESNRVWVIDPIDGTKNYVRGVPVWATLIALMENNRVVVGMVSAPALNRRWWASVGTGAWTGRNPSSAKRCRVSEVSTLSDASLSWSGFEGWEKLGRLDGLLNLCRMSWRSRSYGDFWSHVLVAEGCIDISCEPADLALYDLAALQIIVEEAGGTFTDLDGEGSPANGSVVCSNGRLHEHTLAALGRPRVLD